MDRWARLGCVMGVLLGFTLPFSAAADDEPKPSQKWDEESQSIAKSRLSGSFYIPSDKKRTDDYCSKVAQFRLSGSFFAPNSTLHSCKFDTERKR